MTISSNNRKAGPFIGNGSAATFPFTFKVFQASDLFVVRLTVSTGAQSTLVLGTDYTVTLNLEQDSNPGGSITLVAGALASGYNLIITSDIGNLQPTDLTNQGGFYPEVINDSLDRATIQIQQLQEQTDRTLKYPVTDPSTGTELPAVAQRAGKVLTFDELGAPIAGPSVDEVGTILDNLANITTVANDLNGPDTIGTVATNIADVNTVASNMADVNTVADNIADVGIVADNIADVIIAADNVADINNFADVYQGAKASDPTLRNNGSPLQPGDMYFNTSVNELRLYSGSVWVAGTAGTVAVQRFSGTGSQTDFTLSTAPSGENNTQVYINGVYQQKDTYGVTGTTLTFSTAPPAGTDNIEVVSISTLALGETNAALVSYLPAGTGASERTVQSKLRESVSVKDFGAVGDGVTDDTAAIMAAHDSLPSSGGEIRVPRGSYLHTGTLTFTKRIRLIGEGAAHVGGTVNNSEFVKAATLASAGVVLAANGIAVENMAFRGLSGNGGDGVLIKASRITLRDVSVFSMGNDGIRIGTDTGNENCNLWFLENIKSKVNGRYGLYISEGAGPLADTNAGTLLHPDIQSNGSHGLALNGTQLGTYVGGAYQGNGGYGIWFSQYAKYNIVVGADVEVNTAGQIRFENGADGNTVDCMTLLYSDFSISATSSNNTIRCIDYNVDGRIYRKGIKFPASQEASTDANTLDDYEEGTFTPVVRDNNGGNAATAGTTIGRYTKIGKRVFFDISLININTTGLTSTNQIVITGLPFTSENATSNSLSVVSSITRSSVSATTGAVTASVVNSSSHMTLLNATTTGLSTMNVSSITSGSGALYLSGNYIAAA